jgi:hypothetical protein
MAAIAFMLLILFAFITIKWIQFQEDKADSRPPGSPVPWVSDDAWRALSTGGPPRLIGQLTPTIVGPDLVRVTPGDLARIPGGVPPKEPGAQALPLEGLRRPLLGTTGPFQLHSPVWPVCCNTLGTLINSQGRGIPLATVEARVGPLDQAYLENELAGWGGAGADPASYFKRGWSEVLEGIRGGSHTGQGINLFQCTRCERHFVASCSPG